MLFDAQLLASEIGDLFFIFLLFNLMKLPEVIHVPHLGVEHWEESKKEIKSDHIWKVEAKIPVVGKQN